MIYTRKEHQLQMMQFILTPESNPIVWTNEYLNNILENEVIIGYFLTAKKIKSSEVHILNLYTIKPKYLETKIEIINVEVLKNAFLQWLESLVDDPKSKIFRNPPVKEWLDTKENWAKKIAARLSAKYYKTFDECLSAVYFVVMSAYNKSSVYMGNLWYLELSAENKIKITIRDNRNKLTGDHPLAIHLDATPSDFNDSLDDSVASFHELITCIDNTDETQEYEDLKARIIIDMKKEFSNREIDQILNMPKYLPMPLYRKLLKWRKTHKRSDYI